MFLIINVSNIVPQICEMFSCLASVLHVLIKKEKFKITVSAIFTQEKKSAIKLERMKDLTFIVIIMDIN